MITLPHGKYTLVDDSDFEYLNQWKWHITSKGYVARKQHFPSSRARPRSSMILMHRYISFAGDYVQIDHKNGDKLDNQKSNLRFCTPSQNQAHRPVQINSTTKYKGVSFDKSIRRYRAYISFQKRKHSLGCFETPEAAAIAYNDKAMELHGQFAILNDLVSPLAIKETVAP